MQNTTTDTQYNTIQYTVFHTISYNRYAIQYNRYAIGYNATNM